MEQHFNCTEIIPYHDTKISVHWVRNEYKKKSEVQKWQILIKVKFVISVL